MFNATGQHEFKTRHLTSSKVYSLNHGSTNSRAIGVTVGESRMASGFVIRPSTVVARLGITGMLRRFAQQKCPVIYEGNSHG